MHSGGCLQVGNSQTLKTVFQGASVNQANESAHLPDSISPAGLYLSDMALPDSTEQSCRYSIWGYCSCNWYRPCWPDVGCCKHERCFQNNLCWYKTSLYRCCKGYVATDFISYRQGPIDEQVIKITGGKGVDRVILQWRLKP